jgi:hypothetical protein
VPAAGLALHEVAGFTWPQVAVALDATVLAWAAVDYARLASGTSGQPHPSRRGVPLRSGSAEPPVHKSGNAGSEMKPAASRPGLADADARAASNCAPTPG